MYPELFNLQTIDQHLSYLLYKATLQNIGLVSCSVMCLIRHYLNDFFSLAGI